MSAESMAIYNIQRTNPAPITMDFNRIYCCLYKQTQTHFQIPFLEYLFIQKGDVLDFIEIPAQYIPFFNENVQDNIIGFIHSYIKSQYNAEFKEVYDHNDGLYFFFELKDDTASLGTFALIDEIVNYRKVCNVPICSHIVDLFLQNPALLYICNPTDKQPYEVPVIAFAAAVSEFKLEFMHMFGKSPEHNSAVVGPYFYFTSFESAMQSSPSPFGITRFALFVGNTKIVEQPSDLSASWVDDHQSIYVNTLPFKKNPILAVKSYDQQVPLSRHSIRNGKLIL